MARTILFNGVERPVYLTDIFNCETGELIFTYPSQMTLVEFQDFQCWMQIVMRKMERWTKKENQVTE